MTLAEAREYIVNLTSHVLFDYKGKNCGIDPLSRNKFEMWYGQECFTASTVDEVMTVKFYDGKSLTAIWDDITDLEY